MKTVIILGAGASFESGAPLMADFLDRAKQLQNQNKYGKETQQIQDVLNAAYKDLRPVHAKSTINYKNVEELFSAIDIGFLIQSFGSRQPDTIAALREAIVVFIYRTIEETVRIPFLDRKIGIPKGYDMLAKLIRSKIDKTARLGLNEVSCITFNYDACLEYALSRNNLGVDYALAEKFLDSRENNYQIAIPVLKLHGSINWGTCRNCGVIVPTEIDPWKNAGLMDVMDEQDPLRLRLGTRIAGKTHRCGNALASVPFIVPPTWNKASSSFGIESVWKRAALELASADNIIVIGYSMPVTDMFFKYLFALGSNSDTHLEKFIVVNGADGRSTEDKFKELLGPMAQSGFEFYAMNFSGAGNVIAEVLDN